MESVEQDHQPSSFISTLAIPSRSLTSTPGHDIDKPARGPFTDSSNPSERSPPSPFSSMTLPRMGASIRPIVGDDDVFAPIQHNTRTLRRRSSRLSKWLEEVRIQPSTVKQSDIFNRHANGETVGTECNPYLAYPHLNLAAIRRSMDDASSMHDYVVVNDDDVQEYIPTDEPTHVKGSHGPSDTTSHDSTIRLINTPRSLRQFNLSVRSTSPSASSTSRSPSRLSMFQRSSRATSNSGASNACNHNRSLSHQTSDPVPESRPEERYMPSSSSSWRWRPSVLGHFSSLSDSGARSCSRDSPSSSSRPSMSSTTTSSSCATQSNNIMYSEGASLLPPTSQKSHFLGSLRSRSRKAMTSSLSLFKSDTSSHSSPTLLSLPASEPQLSQPSSFPSPLARKSSTIRLRFSPKPKASPNSILPYILVEEQDTQPRVVYTSKSHTPRMSLSSIGSQSRSTKKKLVISGIPLNDTRRLDAVQKWCQSFGEVDQITRMPNGDLQINFHKAEVADTVCRVRAKVYIAGVGSVYLSWYSGNKRP